MTQPTITPDERFDLPERQVEQLREQLEQSERTLEALHTISLACRGQLAFRPIFEAITRELAALIPYDACYIAVCDTRQTGMFRAALLIDEDLVDYEEYTPYGTLTGMMIERRSAMLYRDLPVDRGWATPNPNSLFGDRQKLSRSWIGVPLLLGEDTVGVISVQSYQPNQYDQGHLEQLKQIGNLAAVAIENANLAQSQRELSLALTEQVADRTNELDALGALAAEIVRQQELPVLLEHVIDLIMPLFAVDGVMIRLIDLAENELVTAAQRGFPEEYVRDGNRIAVEGTLLGRVVTENRPLKLSEVGATALHEHLGLPFQAALSVPLRIGARIAGTLSLVGLEARDFSDQQVAIAQALANQVAIAVESARLFAERDRQVGELAALGNIAHAASTALDLPTLLRRIHSALSECMALDAFSMTVYDPNAQIIIDGISIDEGQEYDYWRRQPPPPDSLTAWIIHNRRPLHFNDLASEIGQYPELGGHIVGSSKHAVSWLGVPLFSRDDQVIGTISIQSYTPAAFNYRDERFLINVARQVALHVQNVSLLTRRERQIRELDAIERIGRAISATFDLDEMLRQIYETLQDVTGASSFYQIICDPDTYEIIRSFYIDGGEHFAHSWPNNRPPKGSLSEWILRNREPMQFYDLPVQQEDLARRGIFPHTFGSESQPRSWTGVPLLDPDGRPIGVITVQDSRAYQYDQQTIEFLSQVASHLSLGIQKVSLFEERERQVHENARLFAEAQAHSAAVERQAKRLERVYRISLMLSSQLDQQELMGLAARELAQLFGADHTGIMLFDEQSRYGVVAAEYPEIGETRGIRVPNTGNRLIEELLATRRPVCITSLADDPRGVAIRDYLMPFGVVSIMVTPLVTRGRVIGSIGIDSIGRVRIFTEDEQNLALTLASSLAAAIENARLFAAEQEARRTADTLRDVARMLSETFDPEEVIQIILSELRTVIPYDTASIMLMDGIGLRIVAMRGWDEHDAPINVVFPLDHNSGANVVVRTRQPLMIADTRQSAYWNEHSHGQHIRSWLGVPLMSKGQVLGVLNIDSRRPQRFSARDVEVATLFAAQASVSLENARLYAESITRVEQELMIARQIQSNLFPRTLPQPERFAVAARCIPARETGGDFYDCFILNSSASHTLMHSHSHMGASNGGAGHEHSHEAQLLAIIVGDASGKSVPGAMLMAIARSVVRSEARDHATPEIVMRETNRLIALDVPHGSFVALSYATIDLEQRCLALANGGQLAPLRRKRDGQLEYLEPPGPVLPLGIIPETAYAAMTVDLEPGDTLVFYTDGVVEAKDSTRHLFGFDRLEALVRTYGDLPPNELIAIVLEAVNTFIGPSAQHDDMTLVVVRVED